MDKYSYVGKVWDELLIHSKIPTVYLKYVNE